MTLSRFLRAGARPMMWAAVLIGPAASAQTQQPDTLRTAPSTSQPRRSSAPIGPSEELSLTIGDAVRRAIDHNPDLAIVKLETDVESARLGEANSAYRPLFTTMFGRSSSAIAPSSFLPDLTQTHTNEWFSSTGVSQRLEWGAGTWSVSWDASRTATNSLLSAFDPTLQSGFQVAFSQPLFRDRRMDSAKFQKVIAGRNLESADLRVRLSAVQTTATVKQGYWTLKAAQANVTVQQRSLELAEDLVRQNKARVTIGQAPPLDLVQAEAEVATRRENLIRADAIAKDAEDRLRRLIMDPVDQSFWQVRLLPVDEPTGAAAPPDIEQAVASALSDRYDLLLARRDLGTADTTVQFYTDQKRPDVRAEASYRGGGIGGTQLLRTGPFPGTVTGSSSTGFGDVLGQAFRHDFPTWSAGVTVSYPIGRSFEEASLTRAEIERRQVRQRIASLQLQVVETVRQAGRQVQSTAERVEAARAGETLAAERLQVEQRRFEAGLSTTFLVTQAQRDLLQAQVNLLQATLDHQSSIVDFEAVQLAPREPADASRLARTAVLPVPPGVPQGIFRIERFRD
jgi:outer membrane protein